MSKTQLPLAVAGRNYVQKILRYNSLVSAITDKPIKYEVNTLLNQLSILMPVKNADDDQMAQFIHQNSAELIYIIPSHNFKIQDRLLTEFNTLFNSSRKLLQYESVC